MIRTQIYLTKEEMTGIERLAAIRGHKNSAVIRQAIDEFLQRQDPRDRLTRLRTGRGLWRDRNDLPDVRKLREEFDRF